jgi:hypothetical protein
MPLEPNLNLCMTSESCVKGNSNFTDWFDVKSGLKQGCILSLLFFIIFINNLVDEVKKLDVGINVNGEKIGILLYADDVVFLCENENNFIQNHH